MKNIDSLILDIDSLILDIYQDIYEDMYQDKDLKEKEKVDKTIKDIILLYSPGNKKQKRNSWWSVENISSNSEKNKTNIWWSKPKQKKKNLYILT